MDWVASAIVFIGNIFLIKTKAWWVFIIFFFGNALWAYYWFVKQEYAAMILVSVFLLQNVWGLFSWKKKGD